MVKRIDEVELCIKMYPKDLSAHLFAFNDFNNELNKMPHEVRDESAYQLQLQWWMNALYDIVRAKKTGNLVADNFGVVAKKYGITVDKLYNYMNARVVMGDTMPFNNLAEMESYAKNVGGTFGELFSIITGGKNVEYFNKLGTAWTLTGLIRNIGFYDAMAKQILPGELLVNDDETSENKAVMAVLNLAKSYLTSKSGKYEPYYLISTVCNDYIKSFRKADGDIKKVDVYNISRVARLKMLARVLFHH